MEIILGILTFLVFLGIWAIYNLNQAVKSYSSGFGAEAGKIDAATKKIESIEEQVKRTTQLSESIKAEIMYLHDFRQIKRQKLEELCELINVPIETIVMLYKTGDVIATVSIPDKKFAQIEAAILKSKVLCMLYFKNIAKPINDYMYELREVLDLYRSQERSAEIEAVGKVLDLGNEVNALLMKEASSLEGTTVNA